MNPQSSLAEGSLLQDRFKVLKEASRKAAYTLYEAREMSGERVVALKTLADSVAQDREAMAQIIRSVELIRDQAHPGLIAIHDFFYERQAACLVEEWLSGAPLLQLLRNRRPEIAEVIELMSSLAKGLDYLIAQRFPAQNFAAGDLFISRAGGEGDDWLSKPVSAWGAFQLKIDPVPLGRGRRVETAGASLYLGSFISVLYQMLGGKPMMGVRVPTYTPLVSLEEAGNVCLRDYVTNARQAASCQEVLYDLGRAEGVNAALLQPIAPESARAEELGDSEAALDARLTEIERLKESMRQREKEQELAALRAELEENLRDLEEERRRFREQVADEKSRLEEEGRRLQEENEQLAAERARQEQLNARLAGLRDDFDTEKARAERELEERHAERGAKLASLQDILRQLESREKDLGEKRQAAAKDERELQAKLLELAEKELALQENIETLKRRDDRPALEEELKQLEKALANLRRESATQEERKRAVSDQLGDFQAQVEAVRREREAVMSEAESLTEALTDVESARQDLEANLRLEFEQRERMLGEQLRALESKAAGARERMELLSRREEEFQKRQTRAGALEEELKSALSATQRELAEAKKQQESAEKELGEALIDLGVDREGAKKRRRRRLLAAAVAIAVAAVAAFYNADFLYDTFLPGKREYAQVERHLTEAKEKKDWPGVLHEVRSFRQVFEPRYKDYFDRFWFKTILPEEEKASGEMLNAWQNGSLVLEGDPEALLLEDLSQLGASTSLSSNGRLLNALLQTSSYAKARHAAKTLEALTGVLNELASGVSFNVEKLSPDLEALFTDLSARLDDRASLDEELLSEESLTRFKNIRDHKVFMERFARFERPVRQLCLKMEVARDLKTPSEALKSGDYARVFARIIEEQRLGILTREELRPLAQPALKLVETYAEKMDLSEGADKPSPLQTALRDLGQALRLAEPYRICGENLMHWEETRKLEVAQKGQIYEKKTDDYLNDFRIASDDYGDLTSLAYLGYHELQKGRNQNDRALIKGAWAKLTRAMVEKNSEGQYYAGKAFFEFANAPYPQERDDAPTIEQMSRAAEALKLQDEWRGVYIESLIKKLAEGEEASLPGFEKAGEKVAEANYFLALIEYNRKDEEKAKKASQRGADLGNPGCFGVKGLLNYKVDPLGALADIRAAALLGYSEAMTYLKTLEGGLKGSASDDKRVQWFRENRALIEQLSHAKSQ